MKNYLIGYSKRKITPTLPVKLAGYNPLRQADGVHDDIYARVMTFSKGKDIHVFLSLDVLAVDHLLYEGIQQALIKQGVTVESLHIFATHTHSSIAGICDTENGVLKGTQGILGDVSHSNLKDCIHLCTEAVLASLETKHSFTMEIARGDVNGVGKERHDPARDGDDSLVAIHFLLENGEKLLLYNFACHPTVLNSKNTLISADLPFGVEQNLEGYQLVLFINGNCGDISTRFTRESSSHEQVQVFGRKIANAIKKMMQHPYYKGEMTQLKVDKRVLTAKAKKVEPVEIARQKCEKIEKEIETALTEANAGERRLLESKLEGAQTNLLLAENMVDIEEIELNFTFIQMNGFTFITVPSEIFSSLTRKLKEKYQVGIFAYCNGFNFYLTDREAYDKNYYEALSSPFEKDQGELLIDEMEKILNERTNE